MRTIELVVWLAALAPKNDCGTHKEETKEVAANAASSGPAVDVTAAKLFADYEANEVSADAIYKDKVLRVSGTITKIGKDILDTPYVELATPNEYMGVQCMFDEAGVLGTLKKGAKLTVRCKMDSKLGNVILRGCMVDK